MQQGSWVLSGQLYVVATPIGNLSDLSERAQAVLSQVDWVAAEDTRHSGQLLAALGVKKPMVSVHEHNEASAADGVIEKLLSGSSVAYVSDAGVPAVSDPGYLLVHKAVEQGVVVVPVPGPSSVLTALCASGLDTRSGFVFKGFVPASGRSKKVWLDELVAIPQVAVFFEAPHRIMATLAELAALIPDRQLVLAKELTKLHERFVRGTVTEVHAQMLENLAWQRGEFVLVLSAAEKAEEVDLLSFSLEKILAPLLEELPLSQAVKLACAMTDLKKNHVYDRALAMKS